jgi:hypothetical protein
LEVFPREVKRSCEPGFSHRLTRALVELARGLRAAAFADAAAMDEAGLRQTLAIYERPLPEKASASGGGGAAPATIADGDESPLPNVHLALDGASAA